MQREYVKYYLSQTGGNLNDIGSLLHSSYRIQRGRGLGNFFGGLIRFLKPAFVSGLNLIKDEAFKTGANILSDIATGANPKEVLQNQGIVGLKNLRKSTVNQLHSMYGGYIRKRKNPTQAPIRAKRIKRKTIKRKGNPESRLVRRKGTKRKTRVLDIFG